MSTSRARLVAACIGGSERIARAEATAPQRWTLARRAADGWCGATHQLLGDGVFGGDLHRTAITAGAATRLVVRSMAAMPLRGPGPGATVTHLRAGPGATLIYLPGALIPQRDSDHAAGLRIDAAAGARVLAATIVVPGRSGMGERGAFRRLRLRTVVHAGGRLAFAEDAVYEPSSADIDSPGMFAGAAASLTVLAAGAWPAGGEALWERLVSCAGIVGGGGSLRAGGSCFRGLCDSLGAALAGVAALETAARSGVDPATMPQDSTDATRH
ncbi:MAG: urease accessory protein UreD [Chloroflexi bacterium]|nr:urease accessory protein UreD [Chloroflexota bacterium]